PTLEVSQLGEFGRHAAALHFEPRPYVDTTTANWNSSRPYKPRRGSQVVRSRSAKPLFAGSIPAPAFLIRCRFLSGNLKRAGWSLGWVSALDREGQTIFVADAHRDDGRRFVVHADERLTAFLELER